MDFALLVALVAVAVAVVAFIKLGTLAQRLEEAIAARGSAPPGNVTSSASTSDADHQKLLALASTVQVLEMRVKEQDGLLCSLVTEDEARHLWNISRGQSVNYDSHPGVQAELRSLVRRRLIAKTGSFKIHELPSPFDLVERFALTEHGEVLLALRKHLEADDLRAAQSIPPNAHGPSVASTAVRAVQPPPVKKVG